ncbi:hypothetical protein NECAME_18930 [Necator americanus]|uniref:Uncharacterized protein n=1 Tax=Necator americanus TaxID=51031 RepID=W2SRC7_NECAM|nr:hypothetical protein NECAME_18930 [Necator americanus]ETN72264.1 hypothetical protein NECAME_18930 [Necator americanus]
MERPEGEALRVHHDDYDHPWELAIPEAILSTLSQNYHQLRSLRYVSRLLGRFRNGQHRRGI